MKRATERINKGADQEQVRRSILTRISEAYRDIAKAEERIAYFGGSTEREVRFRTPWEFKLKEATRALEAAFKELPEVLYSADWGMTAMEFAKKLAEKPKSPKFLKNQAAFLSEGEVP